MARYKDAIQWMADNDDTDWVEHDADDAAGTESVTASLVADLFDKTADQVRADLRHALNKARDRRANQRMASQSWQFR